MKPILDNPSTSLGKTKVKWKPKINDESKVHHGECANETTSKKKFNNPSCKTPKKHRFRASRSVHSHLLKNPTETYTKGKWLPSPASKGETVLRKSSGTIQYWCSPCNRTLASKIIYERHLRSELHFKRTLHDREFDDSEEINFLKSIRRPKPKPPEPIFSNQEEITDIPSNKRNRKKVFMKCEVCQSKVNKDLIGKHLISHYHCRKGDITSSAARRLVLDNIHEIVLEHPFQCSICKFYCNTQEYFLLHWLSEGHLKRNIELPGYYFCIMCKYRSKDTEGMYNHLVSPEHTEVVSVINRSVPIAIKKINTSRCPTCFKEFTLKIQLLKHCEKFQHDDTPLREFKMKFICNICETPFLSNVALSRHFEKAHRKKFFICTPCNLKFNNMAEAKSHRRSQEHKYKSLPKELDDSHKKKCKHCGELFNNFFLLKKHLASKHPEEKIR